MTPDEIRAAATARKAAADRRTLQSPDTGIMDLLRQSPAGQGKVTPRPDPVDVLDPVKGDPTPVTAILDNVIGLDNGVMSPGEKLGTAMSNAGEAMTAGYVGDEAAAAFDAAIGRGSYDDRLAFYRDNQEQFREENPVLSFASEVAPAFIPGMGGAKLLATLTSRFGRAGAGAILGALYGTSYGFMEGEGGAENRAVNAGVTGTVGALFGAAAPKIIDTFTSLPKRVSGALQVAHQRPNVATLEAAKRQAYRAVDQSGEVFSGDDMTRLYQQVSDLFDARHYVEETDDALRATLRVLERRGGKDTTLSQLDGIRQNLWKRYSSAPDQPQILDAIDAIDGLVDTKAGASELMRAARLANSQWSKLKLLEDAFEKAADETAGAGSGGNILNKYRQAVKSIIHNKRVNKYFTAEELATMRTFVRGDLSENILRLVGKLSPNGNGLMMALHIVGGMASSGATLPLMAVGAGAKAAADRSTMRGAEALKGVVSGHAAIPAAPRLTGPQGGFVGAGVPALEDGQNALRGRLRRRP